MDYELMVGSLSSQLRDCISRDALVAACRHGRYDDREYFYEDVIRQAYIRAFRVYIGQLYWFTGTVWELLPDTLLYNGFRSALVDIAYDFFPTIRSEVSKCLRRILPKIKSSCCEPLGVSNSIVGFRNCVVDFGDVHNPVVHSLAEGMPVLDLLDYDYDPDAVCPVWCSFLEQMLTRSQRVLLQKFLGLGCVDRRKVGIEKTLWLIGSGANGKSTVEGVVCGVFGRSRVSTIRLDDLLNRRPDERMRSMYMIAGKVFNYSNEVHESDIMHSADTFKALCSGDKQAVRSLGRDITETAEIPYLICNMNRPPEMRNLDKAIIRRLLQIRFRASVSDEEMDLSLGERLRGEYSGIRNWMLQGYMMLERDGFIFSDEDKEGNDIAVMVENGRTLDAFLTTIGVRDWVRRGQLDEKPQWVKASSLFLQYEAWCNGHNYPSDTMTAFGRHMRERFRSAKRAGNVFYALYADGQLPPALLK